MSDDFFGDLGKSITKATQKAAMRTGSLIESTKINAMITAESKSIEKLYLELGELIYERFQDSPVMEDSAVRAIADELDTHLEKISSYRSELAEVRGMKVCPSCGEIIEKNALFCPKCGVSCLTGEPEEDEKKQEDLFEEDTEEDEDDFEDEDDTDEYESEEEEEEEIELIDADEDFDDRDYTDEENPDEAEEDSDLRETADEEESELQEAADEEEADLQENAPDKEVPELQETAAGVEGSELTEETEAEAEAEAAPLESAEVKAEAEAALEGAEVEAETDPVAAEEGGKA